MCSKCSANSVPISPDIYHTSCMGCSDTTGIYGWKGLAGCSTCELTPQGGGEVNCLDPNFRRGALGGGSIAAIVIVVLLVLAAAGFLIWWFLIRNRKPSGVPRKRGGNKKGIYSSLTNVGEYDRQSLI